MSKPKKYFYIKELEIPLYYGKYLMILTNDAKKVDKTLGKFMNDSVFAHSASGPYKGDEGMAMILNFKNEHSKIDHGVIAHEAAHIANFIFDSRKCKPTFRNDEPYAYLVGWIVKEMYKFIDEYNFKVSL